MLSVLILLTGLRITSLKTILVYSEKTDSSKEDNDMSKSKYSLTISPDGIRFSTGCIRECKNTAYISMVILEDKKTLIVRMSGENKNDSLRWSYEREGKTYGRKIIGRDFSDRIYAMMDWDREYNYKAEGELGLNKIDENEKIWVFDLEGAKECKTQVKRLESLKHI